jgi:transketolase
MKGDNNIDVRDCFFDSVYKLAKKNKKIIFLTSDHSAYSLKKFEKDLPKQFLNLGISEQNIMGVAAGLSMKDKIVFVYGIAPFMSLRCLEQINIDICSMKNNVNIISMGSGLTYSNDGPTHHGTQDQAIMSVLPNMSIYNVSDFKTASLLPGLVKIKNTPKFFRIEKGKLRNIYGKNKSFLKKGFGYFDASKSNIIISTGIMTQTAFAIKEALIKNRINISVLDLVQIKPLKTSSIYNIIKNYKNIISIEENMPFGGIGSIISEIIATKKINVNFLKINLPDEFLFNSGSRDWMHDKYGLSKNKILKKIKVFIK